MVHKLELLERVIGSSHGEFSPELAWWFLGLDFPAADHCRYAVLAGKVQEESLTPEEQAELDDYLNVNAFLAIIQSKARVSLRKHGGA